MCPCHPLAVHSLVQTGPRQWCPPRGGPSLQGLLGCPLPPGAAHPRAACGPPRSSSGSGVLPQTSDTFRPCDLIFPRPPKPSGWQAPRVLPSGPGAGDQPGFLSCGTGGAEVPVGRGGVGTPAAALRPRPTRITWAPGVQTSRPRAGEHVGGGHWAGVAETRCDPRQARTGSFTGPIGQLLGRPRRLRLTSPVHRNSQSRGAWGTGR